MQITRILSVAALLTVAHAHFLLNYPPTRGFDEDKEPTFCGGFDLSPNRTKFPLKGGIVSITSKHPKSDVDILISFAQNVTTFGDFNKTASGTPIPMLLNFTHMNAEGDACFPVDVSALGVPDAKDGANATIQVQFNGGDGQLFQCADVVLSSSATVPSGTACQNATGAFSSANSTASSKPNGAIALSYKETTGILGLLTGLFMTL